MNFLDVIKEKLLNLLERWRSATYTIYILVIIAALAGLAFPMLVKTVFFVALVAGIVGIYLKMTE